jgi:hypothetical protein
MTITSPITITVNAIAKVLPRINQDNFGSVYFLKETAAEYRLTIRHSYEGKAGPAQMERHNAEFVYTTFGATDGKPVIRTTYLVMRNPRSVDPVDSVNISKALFVWANTVAADLGAWAN